MSIGPVWRAGSVLSTTKGELMTDGWLPVHDQEDKLRELLSYCRTMSDGNESGDAREAYDDVANRLTEILDGEK